MRSAASTPPRSCRARCSTPAPHSGANGKVVTNGGRVLCAVGLGATVRAAQQQAYALADVIAGKACSTAATSATARSRASRRAAAGYAGFARQAPRCHSGRSIRAFFPSLERQTRAREERPDRPLAVRRLSEFPGKPGNIARRMNLPPKRAAVDANVGFLHILYFYGVYQIGEV